MLSISSTLTTIDELDGLPINPYEDWEKQTRLDALKVETGTIGPWNPVYVKLNEGTGRYRYRQAALDVLQRVSQPETAGQNLLAIDVISFIFLIRAAQTERSAEVPDQFASFFLWRPSRFAYHDVPGLFEVVFVGPESATLKAEKLNNFGAGDVAQGDSGASFTTEDLFEIPINAGDGGGKVATALIDDQIGFAHERLRSGVACTRFDAIFVHQNESFVESTNGKTAFVHIGGVLSHDVLNGILVSQDEIDIYRGTDQTVVGNDALGPIFEQFLGLSLTKLLTDFRTLREFRASHGTFVGDLAAGYPLDRAISDRPIVGFDLSRLATGDTSGTRLDVFALMGIMFVTGVAPAIFGDKQTIVANLNYALQSGPKDGTGFFEKEASRLVEARNRNGGPTWLVMPSGNSFRSLCRARLSPGRFASDHVDWVIQPGDETPSYAETWLKPEPTATLVITPPLGDDIRVSLTLENSVRQIAIGGRQVARIYFNEHEDQLRVTLGVAPTSMPDEPNRTAPPGSWRLAIETRKEPVSCDWNVQRDDTPSGYRSAGRQSYFDAPNVQDYDHETGTYLRPYPEDGPVGRQRTLSSYVAANNEHTLVVGGRYTAERVLAAPQWVNEGSVRYDMGAMNQKSSVTKTSNLSHRR